MSKYFQNKPHILWRYHCIEYLSYGWFHLATAKICWYWWKLQHCNPCHFLSSNKDFMKVFVQDPIKTPFRVKKCQYSSWSCLEEITNLREGWSDRVYLIYMAPFIAQESICYKKNTVNYWLLSLTLQTLLTDQGSNSRHR